MTGATTSIGLVLLLGLLAGTAYLLERRATAKGNLVTGDRHEPEPGARSQFYLFLLLRFAVWHWVPGASCHALGRCWWLEACW